MTHQRAHTGTQPTPSQQAQTTQAHTTPAGTKRTSARHATKSSGGLTSAQARASFDALAASLPGRVGVAVAPLGAGQVTTYGELQEGHAWSTMKVPVLVTLLATYERAGEMLGPAGHADATRAIEESDNTAAIALFNELEQRYGGLDGASARVQETLAMAGDTQTTVNTAPNAGGFTTWGQSIWSNSGEVMFYRSLAGGCLLGSENTHYVLGLMRNITASQRWGAGAAGYATDVPLAFKAGWGPEATGGYLVRQTAIVGSGDRGYVISMLAIPTSGTFEGGIAVIDALARWAREHLTVSTGSSAGCGGT